MIPTTTLKSADFLESVLQLQPQLAVFDCDGTLWAGDAGERFFDWELKRGLLPNDIATWARARYADYKSGNVSEEDMCGEMVTIHCGLSETELRTAATQFFDENFVSQIFLEMQELIISLQRSGCDVWAVSSTNDWVIRAAMKHFAIDERKVLAASVAIENDRATKRLIRVPSGEGKTQAIREIIGKVPEAAFGNSRWDAHMLALAKHGYAVNPNPDLEKMARERGWTIYWPAATIAPGARG
jgi:phosphoserine phosphatase